ncbi:MAG: peptidylprolyl isomerase [Burkholderiaceae bacterium]|jgi:peptidyl-prolyl cis-trans isomerase SurA|nr:peptidylprolyl isomerase [Burkholderiaceae bacterium]
MPSQFVLRLAAALSVAVLIPFGAAQAAALVEIDRIAAVVNSEAITERELQQQVLLVQRQLREQNIEVPPSDVLERQVLERMIVDRAQMQLARDSGLRVDDAQLERAVATIAAENRLTAAQLRDRLRRQGIDFDQFREEVRGQIVRQRLREREIDSKVQISDADVDAFLAAQSGGASSDRTELHIAQILLRLPEGASAEQIERQRLRAEEIERQLRAGADFGRLAAAFSDAPEAMSGGSLGWRTPDRLPQLFVDAVRSLNPGGFSAVLRSPAGFHVLELIERRSESMPVAAGQPVVQTHARHILIRPNEVVSEEEAVRRLREIKQRIEGGTGDFAELARQYSVDGSAGRGGDLGWVYPGDTVPEFERAMNALAPGQLSDPVRTPFGVHLIQVVERRTDESSPDRLRQQARQALRERRIEENYEDWLRQLRDRTYVEYKLDRYAMAAQPSGER